MNTFKTTYDDPALCGDAIAHDRARELLGQVVGCVAVTVGFTALGAYLGRDLSGATGLVLFIATIPLVLALHIAAARGREQPAIGLLFGLGLAAAPAIADNASADPSALRQPAGATAAFVAAHGAYGHATRRDLTSWARTLFRTLLGLIVFGIVAIFATIPQREHHLRRRGPRDLRRLHDLRLQPAAPQHPPMPRCRSGPGFSRLFNVFLLALGLFGGQRD
jgi:modulator of FtsH protease